VELASFTKVTLVKGIKKRFHVARYDIANHRDHTSATNCE
jgi:hypothetical protein